MSLLWKNRVYFVVKITKITWYHQKMGSIKKKGFCSKQKYANTTFYMQNGMFNLPIRLSEKPLWTRDICVFCQSILHMCKLCTRILYTYTLFLYSCKTERYFKGDVHSNSKSVWALICSHNDLIFMSLDYGI